MNSNKSKEVLIVGAGFAGLIAAITLKSSGIPVKVFEANTEPVDIGGSITMFPNSLRVLRAVGVAEKVVDSGVTMKVAKFQNNKGRHLVNRSMGSEQIYGEPTITLRRSKLNQILLERATELEIDIDFGKKVETVTENVDQVTLECDDSSIYSGAIVLGCDGINSVVRKYVLDKTVLPEYTGLVYYGGFVKDQELISKLNFDINTQYISIGPTHFFAYSYVDNPTNEESSLLWYCYLSQPKRLGKKDLESLEDSKIIKRVLASHDGWHEPVQELIENTVEICKASISDIVEIEKWHKGRILVIGDAAHALNPISGQGAGIAMEDGYLIGKLIEKHGNDYEQAFKNVVKLRKERTTAIARKARKSSKQTTIKYNNLVVKIRNRAFATLTYFTPEKILNKFLSYDVDKELERLS